MLEFIVLGEVPGTHIVITFQWALSIASLLIGIALAKSFGKKYRTTETQLPIEEITL